MGILSSSDSQKAAEEKDPPPKKIELGLKKNKTRI